MRRFMAVLLTIIAILAAGWFAMRRGDIPFDTLEIAYASKQSQFMTLANGTKIHYRDQGPRGAPALVLVHGFSSSLHTWEPWVQRLEADYRVISLDLPGHGLTRHTAAQDISIPAFASVIDETINTLGVTHFTLAGNSMGGNTAWVYALTYPEKLDGLVLVDASGWPETEAENEESPLIFKLLEYPLARTLMKDIDLTSLIRSGLEDAFADPALVTDEMVYRYASLARAPGHRMALLTIISQREARATASNEALATIDMPVLVLQGAEDKLVPAEHARQFAAAIPNADLKLYEAIGHMPQEEIADRTVADLKAFLSTRVFTDTDAIADHDIAETEDAVTSGGLRP